MWQADLTDYCAPIQSAASCAAWPSLDEEACDRLGRMHPTNVQARRRAAPRRRGPATLEDPTSSDGRPAQLRAPVGYNCVFDNASLSAEEELLLPAEYVSAHRGKCRKHTCLLLEHAVSIGLEWCALPTPHSSTPHSALPEGPVGSALQ